MYHLFAVILSIYSSEAYLEGMKTENSVSHSPTYSESEAYLEGMKTCHAGHSNPTFPGSEAYLEGMKTTDKIF